MKDILKMKKPELLAKCKELGITKYSAKNKSELIELINKKKLENNTIENNTIENNAIENNAIENNESSNITCIIEEMDLTNLSKTELLEKCKELGIKKCKYKVN